MIHFRRITHHGPHCEIGNRMVVYFVSDHTCCGISSVTNVTVIVTDVDDQIPTFNRQNFTIPVSEEVGLDTPLPNLNIVVNDGDVSSNAEFNLQLEDVLNSEGVFSVYPTRAIGRTPVIIRVVNPEALDYEQESGRNFIFRVNAGLVKKACFDSAFITGINTKLIISFA